MTKQFHHTDASLNVSSSRNNGTFQGSPNEAERAERSNSNMSYSSREASQRRGNTTMSLEFAYRESVRAMLDSASSATGTSAGAFRARTTAAPRRMDRDELTRILNEALDVHSGRIPFGESIGLFPLFPYSSTERHDSNKNDERQ